MYIMEPTYEECSVDELISQVNRKHNQINFLLRRVQKLRLEIGDIKNVLRNTCEHIWARDYSYGIYERSSFICSICGVEK